MLSLASAVSMFRGTTPTTCLVPAIASAGSFTMRLHCTPVVSMLCADCLSQTFSRLAACWGLVPTHDNILAMTCRQQVTKMWFFHKADTRLSLQSLFKSSPYPAELFFQKLGVNLWCLPVVPYVVTLQGFCGSLRLQQMQRPPVQSTPSGWPLGRETTDAAPLKHTHTSCLLRC